MRFGRQFNLTVIGAMLGAGLLAGCAAPAPAALVAAPRPVCPNPPPPVGSMPAPLPPVSGARQILLPGHWEWISGGYVFTGPRWIPWPGGGTPMWQPGSWRTGSDGKCQWAPGQFVQQ